MLKKIAKTNSKNNKSGIKMGTEIYKHLQQNTIDFDLRKKGEIIVRQVCPGGMYGPPLLSVFRNHITKAATVILYKI